jgi:putative addiction module antidote
VLVRWRSLRFAPVDLFVFDRFMYGFDRCYIICYSLAGSQIMISLKITTVGNSAGVIFPPELMEKYHFSQGDTLYVVETPNGFELSPCDPEFIQQMEIAETVMHEDRTLLRQLAQ